MRNLIYLIFILIGCLVLSCSILNDTLNALDNTLEVQFEKLIQEGGVK